MKFYVFLVDNVRGTSATGVGGEGGRVSHVRYKITSADLLPQFYLSSTSLMSGSWSQFSGRKIRVETGVDTLEPFSEDEGPDKGSRRFPP